jgi:hypothetical protein
MAICSASYTLFFQHELCKTKPLTRQFTYLPLQIKRSSAELTDSKTFPVMSTGVITMTASSNGALLLLATAEGEVRQPPAVLAYIYRGQTDRRLYL